MSKLLKLLVHNLVMGIAAGWVTLGGLLFINIGGLRDILFASSDPILTLVLLAFGFTITFGSLAMGVAIMTLPYDRDPGKGGGHKVRGLMARLQTGLPGIDTHQDLVPVPVKHKS